jgi:hypothetical protein
MSSPFELQLQDDSIARALACGTPTDKVCALFNITPAALAYKRTHSLADQITHYKERLQLATQLHERFVEALAPKALRNLEAVLDNPGHKQHAELSWKVVEKVLPNQQLMVGGNLGLAMSEETANALASGLKALLAHREAQPSHPQLVDDPHMIDLPPERQ